MGRILYLNLNPAKRRTGDCVYRALAFFLSVTWRQALDGLVAWAADQGLTNFNYRSCYTRYLREKGFQRHRSPRKGVTVEEFCDEFAEKGKVYILSCSRHLTIVEWPEHFSGAVIVDTWDCGGKVVDGFWERSVSSMEPVEH